MYIQMSNSLVPWCGHGFAMPTEAQLSFFLSILMAKGDALDHWSEHSGGGWVEAFLQESGAVAASSLTGWTKRRNDKWQK